MTALAPRKKIQRRGRLLALVLVFALTFTVAAPRQAEADALSSLAMSLAANVKIAVQAYFHTLMESIRAKGKYDAARGQEEFRNFVTKQALIAGVQVENMSSPNKSTCRAATALSREVRARAATEQVVGSLAAQTDQQMLGIRPRSSGGTGGPAGGGAAGGPGGGAGGGTGGGPGSPAGGGGPASDPNVEFGPNGNTTASAITRSIASCKYAECDNRSMQKFCESQNRPEGEFCSLAGMDTKAGVLLDAAAIDNQQHYQAAYDFCMNTTINTEMEIATERQAAQGLDKTIKNRKMYSEAATGSLAKFICSEALAARLPEGADFLPNGTLDPASYSQFGAGNPAFTTLYRNMLGRNGWRELDEAKYAIWPPVAEGETPAPSSYSAALYYIPGRAPSLRQREMFNSLGLYDDTRVLGAGVSAVMPMKHTILAKAVTLSQNMQRLRMLERELLLESVSLARKVNKKG